MKKRVLRALFSKDEKCSQKTRNVLKLTQAIIHRIGHLKYGES